MTLNLIRYPCCCEDEDVLDTISSLVRIATKMVMTMTREEECDEASSMVDKRMDKMSNYKG